MPNTFAIFFLLNREFLKNPIACCLPHWFSTYPSPCFKYWFWLIRLGKPNLEQGLANIYCKGPSRKHFRFCRLYRLLCCGSAEAATDNMQTNEHGCAPVKLNYKSRLWTWFGSQATACWPLNSSNMCLFQNIFTYTTMPSTSLLTHLWYFGNKIQRQIKWIYFFWNTRRDWL